MAGPVASLLPELIASGQVPQDILAQMEAARDPAMGYAAATTQGPPAPQTPQALPRMSEFTPSAAQPTIADLYPGEMGRAYLYQRRGLDPRYIDPSRVPLNADEEQLYRNREKVRFDQWKAQKDALAADNAAAAAKLAARRQDEIERHNQEMERARMLGEWRAAREKPLPNPLREKLEAGAQTAQQMTEQIANFKDKYGGSWVMGGLENTLKRWFPQLEEIGDTVGQADWWSAMTGLDNIIRHPLFGSAFTGTEKQMWEQTSIGPRDAPRTIRNNLERRSVILNRAMKRLVEAAGVNYNPAEIESLTGMRPTTQPQRPPLDLLIPRNR